MNSRLLLYAQDSSLIVEELMQALHDAGITLSYRLYSNYNPSRNTTGSRRSQPTVLIIFSPGFVHDKTAMNLAYTRSSRPPKNHPYSYRRNACRPTSAACQYRPCRTFWPRTSESTAKVNQSFKLKE